MKVSPFQASDPNRLLAALTGEVSEVPTRQGFLGSIPRRLFNPCVFCSGSLKSSSLFLIETVSLNRTLKPTTFRYSNESFWELTVGNFQKLTFLIPIAEFLPEKESVERASPTPGCLRIQHLWRLESLCRLWKGRLNTPFKTSLGEICNRRKIKESYQVSLPAQIGVYQVFLIGSTLLLLIR